MSDGIKYDKGKPRPDLVLGDLMPALMAVINIGSFGAFKYAPRNFLKLDDAERRFADAALRHYCKRKEGEIFDDETGEYHLGHEIWDKLAELLFYIRDHQDIEYVLTIRSDCGRYYDPDGLGGREPYFFDEEEGRQMIWSLMDEGVKGIKVDKKPIGDDDVWNVVSPEDEARIEAAFRNGLPGMCRLEEAMEEVCRGTTIPQDGTSGLSVAEPEEGPFGVWNTVLKNWLIRRNEWLSSPDKAKHFTYRSDAVVCIQDQLGFVDAQVCEVREIPTVVEEGPFGVYNTVNKSWFTRRNYWTSFPGNAKQFEQFSDAVECIADQMDIVDQQVCEVRELPKTDGYWMLGHPNYDFLFVNDNDAWVRVGRAKKFSTQVEARDWATDNDVGPYNLRCFTDGETDES